MNMSPARRTNDSRVAPGSPHSSSCSGPCSLTSGSSVRPSTSTQVRRASSRSGTDSVTNRVTTGASDERDRGSPNNRPRRPSSRSRVASKSATWIPDRAVPDVARAPVLRKRLGCRLAELEQLDLEEVLAVHEPPAHAGGVRNALYLVRAQQRDEHGRPAGLPVTEDVPVPPVRELDVGDADGDLVERKLVHGWAYVATGHSRPAAAATMRSTLGRAAYSRCGANGIVPSTATLE